MPRVERMTDISKRNNLILRRDNIPTPETCDHARCVIAGMALSADDPEEMLRDLLMALDLYQPKQASSSGDVTVDSSVIS